MKTKTKTMTRWLALLLCAITLVSLLTPAVNAANASAADSSGMTDLIRSIIPAEGIGDWDEWEYESSNVILVDNEADSAAVEEATSETTEELSVASQPKLLKAAAPKASVLSVSESSKTVYLGRYGWAQYPGGTYVTQYYPIWVEADANGDYHEGDMNWSRFAYCACPSMPGMSAGFHTGDVEKLSADSDVSGATLNVFKAVMITCPYGPWGGVFKQDFWKWAEDLETDKGETYSIVHALLGYLYDPNSVGQPYQWSQTMKDNILGSGGMLEQIIQWANANADICDLVTVYRIKGNGSLQDIVWPEYEPLSKVTLKKVSADPSMTNGNSEYSLAGAVYDVYKDSALTKIVGTLTTDANGDTGTIQNLVPGTYYAKERTAPKGFNLSSDVLSVTIASDQTGTFQASDSPIATDGSGKLIKKSANPEITNGNSYYSLEGAEYTVYSDSTCKTSVGVLKTTSDGTSQLLTLKAGTYYVKETKAPSGFTLDSTVHKMVVEANKTTTLTVEDQYIPAYVTLKKVSTNTAISSGNSNYTLAGAVYGVYSDSKCSNKVGELTTKADGTSNTLTVPAGTYYAKEVTAPKGYMLNTEVHTVTVKPGETGTFRASDVSEMGTVSLLKSSVVKDCGISLAGAEYSVYSDAECKNEVAKLVTDKDGKSLDAASNVSVTPSFYKYNPSTGTYSASPISSTIAPADVVGEDNVGYIRAKIDVSAK